MIVAFTGHRPNKLGGFLLPNPTYIHVCQQLEKTIKELQPTEAISGMALGIDQWAANICRKLGIPFTAAIPFVGQEKAWPEASQKTFRALLNKATKQVIVSEGGYAAAKMQIRNEYMCDHCDVLVAVWDGTSGGTGNCVKYAQSIGKQIIFIDPKAP
jgi:uncharacterized phage-like protein YoqJ